MELNNKKTKKKINYVSRVPLKLVALFESLALGVRDPDFGWWVLQMIAMTFCSMLLGIIVSTYIRNVGEAFKQYGKNK